MLRNLLISAPRTATVRLHHTKCHRAVSVAISATQCRALKGQHDLSSRTGQRRAAVHLVRCVAVTPGQTSGSTKPESECTAEPAGTGVSEPGQAPSRPLAYGRIEERAERDPGSLTADELRLLVRGLPRHFRHKHVPPKVVEEAFDGGMLTLHELARTNGIDLNRAVKYIGENGQLLKALRLTNYLVLTGKGNQHTLAAFFQACESVNRPMLVPRLWEVWMKV